MEGKAHRHQIVGLSLKNMQFCNEQIRTQPLFSPPRVSATYGSARMCRRKNYSDLRCSHNPSIVHSPYFHLHAWAPPTAVPGCVDKRIILIYAAVTIRRLTPLCLWTSETQWIGLQIAARNCVSYIPEIDSHQSRHPFRSRHQWLSYTLPAFSHVPQGWGVTELLCTANSWTNLLPWR